jgi:putative flavoprotein involved in K+ transport
VLDDGTELEADLVVYATGYGSMNGWVADLVRRTSAGAWVRDDEGSATGGSGGPAGHNTWETNGDLAPLNRRPRARALLGR